LHKVLNALRARRAYYGHVIGEGYLDHLTDGDLRLLAETTASSGVPSGDDVSYLRSRPGEILSRIAAPALYDRLFSGPRGDIFIGASPFLIFAVAIERSSQDLKRTPFVMEWAGPRRRLPLFDAGALSGFLDDSNHRLFLSELLASYTHAVSGVIWRRDARRWRPHRYSELDPVRLAALLDVVPEQERSGIYRRLGDAALFLTGVFPDYSERWLSSPLNQERLGRAAPRDEDELAARAATLGEEHAGLRLLEELGRRWYRLAHRTAAAPQTYGMRVLASVENRFSHARRVLNFITERYLFGRRWWSGELDS
jgi:hypothetical protein